MGRAQARTESVITRPIFARPSSSPPADRLHFGRVATVGHRKPSVARVDQTVTVGLLRGMGRAPSDDSSPGRDAVTGTGGTRGCTRPGRGRARLGRPRSTWPPNRGINGDLNNVVPAPRSSLGEIGGPMSDALTQTWSRFGREAGPSTEGDSVTRGPQGAGLPRAQLRSYGSRIRPLQRRRAV